MFNKILAATSIFLALALFPKRSLGDEVFLSYGLGVFGSERSKIIELGERRVIWDSFYWNFEGGGWIDPAGDGRSSSFFVASGPGYKVDLNPIEIRNSYGLMAISNTDAYLGGYFPQFYGEIYFGARDKHDNGIGVKINHGSSAGIYNPNVGRNFVQLELSTRF